MRGRSRTQLLGSSVLPIIIAIAFLLAVWQLLAVVLQLAALPVPGVAFRTFLERIVGDLGIHLQISTYRVVVSIIVSLFLAVPLGLFLGREPRFDAYIAPMIYVVYPVPKIVFLPVIIAIFGLGDFPKILLIVLVIFFQILVTTRDAARKVDQATIDSILSLGASKLQVYRQVIWPAALPDVFTALRIVTGTAIAVLFISETFVSREGLGYFILDAWSRSKWDEVYAGIIAMGLLGIVLYGLLDYLDRKVCRWKHL
ncbi:MAG: ABC transporter permease [Eubacteriales bacterium]|nr:ABC transporter permease [Bacillota bacterium]MBV1726688.1 ABC transporter permease [Desulforudis sp.]MDQ7788858.1 ABC transporter permease [Clostridia bacterium]MDZ4042727.1 ABC transporter permease [Eubacteriales bacterium]MBU4533011.1 ABC transporter permease [Bacillota bacterium]